MKLHSISLVFVFGVVGLAKIANGLCLIRNSVATPKMYWYHCFTSNNYLADVQSAPIDTPRITFTNSNIPVVRNKSFSRLINALEILEINYCETKDIQDNAFEGLVKLRKLEITGNHLKIVKGVWFKDLPNLETISFRDNEIERIEESFFSIVPLLETLDVTTNRLNCLPMDALASFKTKKLRFRHNPLSWGCVSLLIDWVEKTGIEYDDFGRGYWDPSSELVIACEDKLGKLHNHLNEENIKKCAEKMVVDLLPPQENYTVKEVCQFLKDKPSPFLFC